MLYQISDGTVTAGGEEILSHIDFEIHGTEKIAIVGKNGAGKTTLLNVIAGMKDLERDDRRRGAGILSARKVTVAMLSQQPLSGGERTVEEEILAGCPCEDPFDRDRYEYEQEYGRLFSGFGFSAEEKKKRLSEFSGGQKTKIALIRLLLKKPDILLLDEPTNHLDVQTTEWLELYLKQYEKAVVMVSHDRFFLDRVAEVVYELSGKKLRRYPGNYTNYRKEKEQQIRQGIKAYERQCQEEERLQGLIDRFKHKPRKAAFARAKKKQMERMERVEKPERDGTSVFTGEITPANPGSKWVFESEHLKLGYERELLELTIRIRRGQKIGILGPNGAGKTTFLKTAAGLIRPFAGTFTLGKHVTVGYFDQNSSDIRSEKSVLAHFHDQFPSMTEKEVRSVLGAYLFGGRDAMKSVNALSGGEKARLVLAELLQSRPNFLILDEPTNHMDLHARETLESAFQAYTGTILFVSHDRYFIRQIADAVLIFDHAEALYYPFGYEHYLERKERESRGGSIAAQIKAEDQALIAGMKAVPKAERHSLREVPEEEAYREWKLKPAAERLAQAQELLEELEGVCACLERAWKESEEFWIGVTWSRIEEYDSALIRCRNARDQWHSCCLEWWDELCGLSLSEAGNKFR